MNTAIASLPPSALAPVAFPSDERIRESREIVARLGGSETYRSYEDAFETTTGLPLALRPLGAFQSPLNEARNAKPFCALMAATGKTCAACLQFQQRVEESSSTNACTMECFVGLSESAVPIMIGEKVVAFLQTGQVMLRRPSAAQFRRAMKRIDGWGVRTADRAAFERAYFSSRVMTKAQYESILSLLTIFAEHLSSLSNQLVVRLAAAESPAIAKARRFIAEHQGDEISLGDVARAANMSSYYFCKSFRKGTGVTFVDYLARLRVERVKGLLLNPHKRISEAAFEAGFQSLSQFNRVFRRIAGEAPIAYRARLHGAAFPSSLASSHAFAA
ncbi:MAG: PocR ligand-binding domain-containing protein [Opitutaceae bacterium]